MTMAEPEVKEDVSRTCFVRATQQIFAIASSTRMNCKRSLNAWGFLENLFHLDVGPMHYPTNKP
jgi:hypothetical protein